MDAASPPPTTSPTRAAAVRAAVLGCAVAIAIVVVLSPFADDGINRGLPALLLLLPVVVTAVKGGWVASLAVAVVGVAAFATAFLPPLGSPGVDTVQDQEIAVLFLFVATITAVLTASTVGAERRRAASERSRREALERLDQERAQMLRAVSHDLRTPLASIHAAATDLRAGTPYDEATRDDLLDLIVGQSERLDRLVQNVLSVGRIEAGGLVPDRQAIDVAELVEACVTRLRRLLAAHPVRVAHTGDATAEADWSQVDQVVTNLLENAATYAPPGTPIEVLAHGDAAEVAVSVVDHGPGVDPALRPRVFDPYATSNGGATHGIGLTICRSIVEAHGGTIEVADTPGGGATFRFTLPRRAT